MSAVRVAGENATELLYVLADQTERGVLFTADWLSADAKEIAVDAIRADGSLRRTAQGLT
jgi:hypothetical protein